MTAAVQVSKQLAKLTTCPGAYGIVIPTPAYSAILLVTFDLPRKKQNKNYLFIRQDYNPKYIVANKQ